MAAYVPISARTWRQVPIAEIESVARQPDQAECSAVQPIVFSHLPRSLGATLTRPSHSLVRPPPTSGNLPGSTHLTPR